MLELSTSSRDTENNKATVENLLLCVQGLRNDLKAAMDKIDQQYLNEIVGGTESGELDTQHDLKVHEENTTIEEFEVRSGRSTNSDLIL